MQDPFLTGEQIKFPQFYRVRMEYPDNGCDSERFLSAQLDTVIPESGITPGSTVGVCVGSRGITNLSVIVKQVCTRLKQEGAKPFIIPAMGSHGGADSDGQRDVLKTLGIDESACDVPVLSSMEVKKLGSILDGVNVYCSADCLKMDHAVVINRIKPHTKFKGPVESGLYKMLSVGMGKHKGAIEYHQAALRHGFYPVIKAAGDKVLEKGNVRFGVGIVEGRFDETIDIRACLTDDFFQCEQEMLECAKNNFPKLPFHTLDALIVRNVGKDISGAGMDPNVTGRAYDLMEDDFSGNLDVTRIVVLDLSEKTAGNGIGIGNADIITESVFKKLDYDKMLINALTSVSLRKAFIPVMLPNDRQAIVTAFSTVGLKDIRNIRAVIIRNTRSVSEFMISEALVHELNEIPEAVIGKKESLTFSPDGGLVTS